MMCCVYGVCKVSEKEIKFKDIVTAYRTLPFSEPHVRSIYCQMTSLTHCVHNLLQILYPLETV